MKLVLSLVLAVVLQVGAWPAVTQAQASCRFVLGFADIAARLSPSTVGICLEDQHTLPGNASFVISGGLLDLPAGTAVQRTTTGLLFWLPQPNLTEFVDASGFWQLAGAGVTFRSWDQINLDSHPPTAPPAATVTPYNAASADCLRAESAPLIASVTATPDESQRLKAEADAIDYLCGKALDDDGPPGVACFFNAWDASKGMERVFPGSGMKVYDEKYRACMGRH